MQCKDSEVFALEGSIEKILNNTGWKNVNEISDALTNLKNNDVKGVLKFNNKKFFEEESEELLIRDVMDRLCVLFPMKYQRKMDFQNEFHRYKRIAGFQKE